MSEQIESPKGQSKHSKSRAGSESAASPVGKLFAVLEHMAQSGSIGVTSLSAQMGMPKTTVHRIVSQLEKLGYVQREPGGRQFLASPRLVNLAHDLLGASVRLAPRHQVLSDLSSEVGETCSLGVRAGYEIVYIDAVTVMSPLAIHFQPGRRAPLHCTSIGKLFLAEMLPRDLDTYLQNATLTKYTEFTIVNPDQLRTAIREAAAEGFASSVDEFVLGVAGSAVPVRTSTGRMLAGLTVSIPAARIDAEGLADLRAPLERAAARLSNTFES